MSQSNERIIASDRCGAFAIRGASMHESVIMRGVYDVEVWSPPEHLRAEYSEMRARLDDIRGRGPVYRAANHLQAIKLRKEIEGVPLLLVDRDVAHNLVVTVGKNDLLDRYFAGSGYTATHYLGLIGSTGYTTGVAAGDTMASHGGWAEDTTYSNANRVTMSWSAASGGSKSLSSAAAFNINGTVTEKGCFATTNNTKGGTTGVLYSGGLFSGGDKTLANGDTLSVSYTASA